MYSFQKLKIIAFASIILVVTCLTNVNFSHFGSLRADSSVEVNVTPTPTNLLVNDFRPDGGFEFKSKPPKPFKDIIWLSVITGTGVGYGSACAPQPCAASTPSVENRVDWIPQAKRGLLVTKYYNYNWRDENLSVDNFSFVTETHKGQSYKFTGRFLTGGNFEEIKPEETVLTGRLVKLVDGQSAAEEEVSFGWFSWSEVDQQTFRR